MKDFLPVTDPAFAQLWDASDLKATELRLLELLAEKRTDQPAAQAGVAEVLTWLARVQGAQGGFPQAGNTLREAEACLLSCKLSENDPVWVRYHLELGRLHSLEKTPSRARPSLRKAWQGATAGSSPVLTLEIASLMASLEPPREQERWLVMALDVAEQSQAPKAVRAELQLSMAWKKAERKEFEGAKALLDQTLPLLAGNPSRYEYCLWSIGRVLRDMQQPAEALASQHALERILRPESEIRGRVYEEIAECLLSLRKTEESCPFFDRAFRFMSSDNWKNDGHPLSLGRLRAMATPRRT